MTAARPGAEGASGPRPDPVPAGFAGASAPGFRELLGAAVRWPRPSLLAAGVGTLRGVGPKTARVLAEDLGVETVGRLQWHLPRELADPPPEVGMRDLEPGRPATVVGVVGTVGGFEASPGGRGKGRLEASLADARGEGSIRAVWFNQPWMVGRLEPGSRVRLTGSLQRQGFVVSATDLGEEAPGAEPAERTAWTGEPGGAIHSLAPVPVHPATERLGATAVRRLTWAALARSDLGGDPLPAAMRRAHGLSQRSAALRAASFPGEGSGGSANDPASRQRAELARRRLAFEELVLQQISLQRRRFLLRSARCPDFVEPGGLADRWLESLELELTSDQRRAFAEIDADLTGSAAMQRLLMGEVGSGKTLVAAYAVLRAVESGHQAALMAPTEVLAEQHAMTLSRLLEGTGVGPELVTGSVAAAPRRGALGRLAGGQPGVAIGTHALLEADVDLAGLGLCVIDEQHRFGVAQRARLAAKAEGRVPHLLHMSATPIPRTLAAHRFGDLDVTTLRELPRGRLPVRTRLVEGGDRHEAFAAVRRRLEAGEQAFVICPLVEESEDMTASAVATEAARLRGEELAGHEIAELHGRMRAGEKQAAIAAFTAGRAGVLVSTTVVEVGVDVPNATIIVIEGAERFGLAQLHQLRGRVGRGAIASECVLIPEGGMSQAAAARLRTLVEEADGFRLAERDLQLRGGGELLGSRQHGSDGLLAAELPGDAELLQAAHAEARRLALGQAPVRGASPEGEILLDAAERRFPAPTEHGVSP